MKINFPLLALAIGAFGIGTTEFSPMGDCCRLSPGGGRLYPCGRYVDQRLRHRRDGGRAADDAAVVASRTRAMR